MKAWIVGSFVAFVLLCMLAGQMERASRAEQAARRLGERAKLAEAQVVIFQANAAVAAARAETPKYDSTFDDERHRCEIDRVGDLPGKERDCIAIAQEMAARVKRARAQQ